MSFDWKSVVGTVAPTIATALLGPLAGTAVGAIGAAIGLTPEADNTFSEEAIAVALKNPTPELLARLKEAEQTFTVEIKKLDVDLVRIAAADRDSAREREYKTKDVWTPRILAALAVVGFFGLVAFIIATGLEDLPNEIIVLIGTCVGYALSLAKDAYAYYFGSSQGSFEKNNLLYNSTPRG